MEDGDKPASARGYEISEISDPLDRFISVITWPLKRDYFQPTFRVTARIGSTEATWNSSFLIRSPRSGPETS